MHVTFSDGLKAEIILNYYKKKIVRKSILLVAAFLVRAL